MKFTAKISIVFFILVITLTHTNCSNSATSSDDNSLVYQESTWAKKSDSGRMVVVADGIFKRGDVINLVVRNVGKFKKGDDGKHKFDIDMVVKDPSQEIILDQKELLGEKGHISLEDDTASSPYGIFESHVNLTPGTYQMTLTITDKIGSAQLTLTKSFKLTGELSFQKAIFAKKREDGSLSPVEDAIFSRGEAVNLILLNVGKFKKGDDGKHRFDININVKDSTGKLIFEKEDMLAENGHLALENDIAKSPYGIFYSSVELDAGPYNLTLTIIDKIGNQKVSVTKAFSLE